MNSIHLLDFLDSFSVEDKKDKVTWVKKKGGYCAKLLSLWRGRQRHMQYMVLSLTDDNKILGVFQEFSKVKNLYFQDPIPNFLSAKTKRYQVISATVIPHSF